MFELDESSVSECVCVLHSEAKLLLEMKQTVTRVFKILATAIKERGSVPVAVAGFSITGVFPLL